MYELIKKNALMKREMYREVTSNEQKVENIGNQYTSQENKKKQRQK